MTTSAHHLLIINAEDGEARLQLTCSAPSDAYCRRRPRDHEDRESWSEDELELSGFECWAVEFIRDAGTDQIILDTDGPLASIPVSVGYDDGVSVTPIREYGA